MKVGTASMAVAVILDAFVVAIVCLNSGVAVCAILAAYAQILVAYSVS